MKKFLIIQTAFIGDVILATPIIEKLHQFYPDATIDFLLRKGNETLLEGHPFINNLIIWDKGNRKWRTLFSILKKIRKQKYSHVINLQRFMATGLLTAFSSAPERIGFDKNPLSFLFSKSIKHRLDVKNENPHEMLRNLSLVHHITDGAPVKPRLYPSQNDFSQVQHLKSEPYICIAPASVWFTKQFPAVQWAAFLNSINVQINVYFLGSSKDKAMVTEIMNAYSNDLVNTSDLCGQLSLLESAALMQNALMNYVNDSAPMHICSAVDAPTTAVFCSTLPSFGFGPLASKAFIVETQEKLNCRPCGNHGLAACPEGHFKCAMGIDVSALHVNDMDLTKPIK